MPQSVNQELRPRLCILRKWDNFPGYGFNLQAEKGKPGQFIGNVDTNSPSEACGLKKNDRVIEVNGVNVCNESHKQVVARIRETPGEVSLLLMDPATEKHYLENGIVVKSDMDIVQKYEVPAGSPSNGLKPSEEPPASPVPEVVLDQHVEEPAPEEPVVVPEDNDAALVEETQNLTVNEESVDLVQEPQEESPAEERAPSPIASPDELVSEVTAESPPEVIPEPEPEPEPSVIEEPEVKSEQVEEVHAAPVEANGNHIPKVSSSGDVHPPAAEIYTTPTATAAVPVEPTGSVNGNSHTSAPSTAANDPLSIFQKPAHEVRAMHARSKRRAIKETNQTFKEKYHVFENL